MLPDGDSVLCHHAAKTEDEARWIASQMFALNDSGVPFHDMTVLYRAHYITRTIEDVLRHYDAGGKKCPLYYVENEEEWQQLLNDLKQYVLKERGMATRAFSFAR